MYIVFRERLVNTDLINYFEKSYDNRMTSFKHAIKAYVYRSHEFTPNEECLFSEHFETEKERDLRWEQLMSLLYITKCTPVHYAIADYEERNRLNSKQNSK